MPIECGPIPAGTRCFLWLSDKEAWVDATAHETVGTGPHAGAIRMTYTEVSTWVHQEWVHPPQAWRIRAAVNPLPVTPRPAWRVG